MYSIALTMNVWYSAKNYKKLFYVYFENIKDKNWEVAVVKCEDQLFCTIEEFFVHMGSKTSIGVNDLHRT